MSQIACAWELYRNTNKIVFLMTLSFLCGQLFVKFGQFLNKCGQFPICLATRGMSYQMSVLKDLSEDDDLWNGWWTRGWRWWQEVRYMRLHHCPPVRKTPNLIRLHLSFFEGGEKNKPDFPTTLLIKASAETSTNHCFFHPYSIVLCTLSHVLCWL